MSKWQSQIFSYFSHILLSLFSIGSQGHSQTNILEKPLQLSLELSMYIAIGKFISHL